MVENKPSHDHVLSPERLSENQRLGLGMVGMGAIFLIDKAYGITYS